VLDEMLATGRSASEIRRGAGPGPDQRADRSGRHGGGDRRCQIRTWRRSIGAANSAAALVIGEVMKATRGQANVT